MGLFSRFKGQKFRLKDGEEAVITGYKEDKGIIADKCGEQIYLSLSLFDAIMGNNWVEPQEV